ncbi:MAG: hypothetical protein DWI22_01085 [Planctomycetota bacterium]|nr:hypothetical protein [Planctomycetales bacterium]RLT11574.1 MAG: hypothetical protein DWI22_01085 [Planctomycetota bacterium]
MIESFVLKLLTGITLMWLLMPRREVTDGFFRIQMLVALGLSVLLVLVMQPSNSLLEGNSLNGLNTTGTRSQAGNQLIWFAQLIAAVIAFSGHIVWKLGRRLPGALAIYTIAMLCLLSLVTSALAGGVNLDSLNLLLSDLGSAAVLGATLTGMLLGHWYLTTPTMSIGPLAWFTKVLAVAAVVRLLMTSLALFRFGFAGHDLVHLLWLIVRIIGGILVPFATAVVVMRILKYRNTQSATGILFAALILVFMGEMSAALLERDLRIPY